MSLQNMFKLIDKKMISAYLHEVLAILFFHSFYRLLCVQFFIALLYEQLYFRIISVS